jgi:hypothetical protein
MKSAGSTFLFFGIGTILLNIFGYEFSILSWIDNWGEAVGWTIRGAMVVLGIVLFILGGRTEEAEGEPATE